ncbi:MAG: STAS domain-containing protein [Ignavibacteriae bacterium]|nr:STAS domain-containing protein [Ignavibacteriota bacterium]
MNLSLSETETVTIIKLEGSILGGPDAAALKDKVHELIEKKLKNFVLDLKAVKNMNSSGLGMLMASHATIRNAGGHLKIAGASKKIENLLVITRLTNVFELYPTVKKAVESFSK